MVCVNTKPNSNFKAFDIPLAMLIREEFKQPIFGSNYIKGVVKPLFNLIPGNIEFKIWFTEGGCGTFVPSFLNLAGSVKKSGTIDQKIINMVSSGLFAKSAYIDPNDPSVIYLEQPQVVKIIYKLLDSNSNYCY
jgi:hypothetical protein